MNKFTAPVIMHINYFEQGQSIDYLMRKAKVIGYDGIEFRSAPNKFPEMDICAYLDEIKRCKERYGVRYTLFGGPGIEAMSQDDAKLTESMDRYKTFLTEADKRGLLSLNNFMTGWLSKPGVVSYAYETYGSAIAEDWQWEKAAKACQEIADFAPQVKFAFETHMGYIHDLATTSMKLVNLIDRDNFGVNLDYGNAVYFASGSYPSLAESISVCGRKLFYTHWKNSIPGNPRRTPTALSQGDINHREYLRLLMEADFDGLLGIEAPRSGDREFYAKEDYLYVRGLIDDANE